MEYVEDKEFINPILGIFVSLLSVILAVCIIFFIGVCNVEAQSYYFDVPEVHRFCDEDLLGGACFDYSNDNSRYLDPGYGVGNYYNAIYDVNNANNLGANANKQYFEAGTYSVSFSGAIRVIESASLSPDLFKIRLLYYPNSSNLYGVATCDNNEQFTINYSNINTDLYYYTYSCETLNITEGKSFLGWNIYLDIPGINLVNYFEYAQIDTNLTLIGEGDATNSDIINNNNQNTQDIINNNNANTDKITDSVDKNTEEQKETNDYLKDDTPPSSDISGLGNIEGLLPPGPLDTLLNIPIQFLSSFITGLGETCSPLTFNFFWDMEISFPCLSDTLYNQLPTALEYAINLIPGVLILIKYLKYLYKKVERATSFNTNADDLWGAI